MIDLFSSVRLLKLAAVVLTSQKRKRIFLELEQKVLFQNLNSICDKSDLFIYLFLDV